MTTISYPYSQEKTDHQNYFSNILTNPLLESIAKVSAFAIAAIVALVCGLSFSTPLFVIAATMLATQLAVKTCNYYNVAKIYELQEASLRFQRKYPYLQAITLIFVLAVAPLSVVVSSLTAAAFGIFSGIVVGADHCRRVAKASSKDV